MTTNDERREIANKLYTTNLCDGSKEQTSEAFCVAAIQNLMSIVGLEKERPIIDLRWRLAKLIEPDYTSEESGYFILPKPKDPLVCQHNTVDGSSYDIINENVREWQRQIEEGIQQKLFETFRKTCKNVGEQMTCSECGAHVYGAVYEHSFVNENGKRIYTTANEQKWNYCPNCGAKVTSNDAV